MAARQGDEAKSVFGCDPDATEFEPASAGAATGFPIVGIGASAGGLAAPPPRC